MAGVDALKRYLGKEVIGKDGRKVSIETLIGPEKTIGLFFSANRCPSCRSFTPVLIEFYKECKKKNPNFEIVFFSRDHDKKTFKDYYKDMPWLAIPFSNQEQISATKEEFNISGIPTFVLLNGANGEVIHANARSHVSDDPHGNSFPWTK